MSSWGAFALVVVMLTGAFWFVYRLMGPEKPKHQSSGDEKGRENAAEPRAQEGAVGPEEAARRAVIMEEVQRAFGVAAETERIAHTGEADPGALGVGDAGSDGGADGGSE